MFFIVPSVPPSTPPPATAGQKRSRLSKLDSAEENEAECYYRRRVPTACDRCRLKKVRCSGGYASCEKCKRDGVICVISKGRKLDLKPKAPGYVKMVESQRDLLLRAVHELRQRSLHAAPGTRLDLSADMNTILHELNIQADASGNVSQELLQEFSLPQDSPEAHSTDHEPTLVDLCEESVDFSKMPWVDTVTIGSPSLSSNMFNHGIGSSESSNTPEEQITVECLPGQGHLQDEFCTSQTNNEILPTQWTSTFNDQYFGYDMDMAVSNFMDLDGSRQPIWQDGEMKYSVSGLA